MIFSDYVSVIVRKFVYRESTNIVLTKNEF